MIVLVMGLPGSGKGSMSRRLQNNGFSVIATGKLIRDEIFKDTELGKKLKKNVDEASYVDDDIVLELVKKHFSADKDIIFEGFPRNAEQAKSFENLLLRSKKKIDLVLHFDFTEEEMYNRLKGRQICKSCQAVYHEENFPSADGVTCDVCGTKLIHRIDDQPEKLKRKLEQYRSNIKPLIEMYKERGLVHTIDACQSSLDMYYDIIQSHKNFMVRHA